MFCKKFELGRDMSQFVADARKWAKELVRRETRGWGDLPRAMRCVARHCGVDYATLHALRYRPPKGVDASVYERLEAAYLAMCAKQETLHRHERKITLGKTPIAATLVRAADALARAEE